MSVESLLPHLQRAKRKKARQLMPIESRVEELESYNLVLLEHLYDTMKDCEEEKLRNERLITILQSLLQPVSPEDAS